MNKKLKKNLFAFVITIVPICLICLLMWNFYFEDASKNSSPETKQEIKNQNEKANNDKDNSEKEIKTTDVLLTFIGDNVLGGDTKFSQSTSLPAYFNKSGKDYDYFFQNVKDIFSQDDLTIANLETTFTNSSDKADKGSGTVFHFKGDPEYANILGNSSIETVTLSNNHTYDYGIAGFNDTINTLNDHGIGYFGEGYKYIKEIKGVKFGFLGYQGFYISEELKNTIIEDMNDLRDHGCMIVVPYFHFGDEKSQVPNDTQISLSHFAIDNGADMVMGSHSHVIQPLESYKGKLIVYSLANFCFGGNSNPSDKRTFILQTKLKFKETTLTDLQFKVIPTRVSSTEEFNDYKPTPYTSPEKEEIIEYINSISPSFEGTISHEFISMKN